MWCRSETGIAARGGAESQAGQGNRVRDVAQQSGWQDRRCPVIRCSVKPDRPLGRGFACKALAHGFQGHETGGRVPGPQATCLVAKDPVRHPVARVFAGPPGTDHRAKGIGRAHRHGDAQVRCAPGPVSAATLGRKAPAESARARRGKAIATAILRAPAPGDGPQAPPQGDLRLAETGDGTKPCRTGRNRQTCAAGSPERWACAEATPATHGPGCGTGLRCIGFQPGQRPQAGAEPLAFAVPSRALVRRVAPVLHALLAIGVSGPFHPEVTPECPEDRRLAASGWFSCSTDIGDRTGNQGTGSVQAGHR